MTVLRGGPLQGVRVVELTKVWAGPYTGKLLSYLGAEVIRVESLDSLDITRVYGVSDMNNAPGFQAVNPQKLSVQINMKTPAGVALVRDLLSHSDIVIENLRPGATKRLGLGYETVKAVKPDIVYVSMGMYGSEGPLSYQTGYAPCFAALGGISALVGYEGESPAGMNVRYADSTFGAAAAYAATVALLHRRRTGVGQFVDVSAVEVMSSMIGDSIISDILNSHRPASAQQGGEPNSRVNRAPHGVYPCANGEWLSIVVNDNRGWQQLAAIMGRPELADDARFSSLDLRRQNSGELDNVIASWTADQDAGELEETLSQQGVGAAKSQSSLDLIADPRLWGRGFFHEVQDCTGHSKSTLGPSWKMTRGAAVSAAAPHLGEHNSYVLGDVLGLSAAEQQRLKDTGICQ